MGILIGWFVNALALIITANIVSGFSINNFTTALLAAIVIGLINTFIRPFLLLLTLPINILTLGLFTFVVNAIVLWLATLIIYGMHIATPLDGILAAIVLSVVSAIFSSFAKNIK